MISLPQNSENLNWLWARRLFLQYFATAVHFETAKIALRNIGTWWAYATEQIRLPFQNHIKLKRMFKWKGMLVLKIYHLN